MKPYLLKYWLFCGMFFAAFTGWAQSSQITGYIFSQNDGSPLSGVSVLLKGKLDGTQTNNEGNFSITASPADVLVISFVGYETQEIPVGQRTSFEIALSASESKMDEIVVVGYGTQRRSQITGSVSKLDSKVLETGVRSNPASALAGTIPGLRVQQTSGRPGAVPNIVLRGGTTFGGGGAPLVIVDGILRAGFSDMNSDDIESIEVLKDASATAIYGARASNGVILITTKSGKSGKSQISVNGRLGMNRLNIPFNFLNGEDYLYWARTSVQNSGVYDPGRLSQLTTSGPFGTGNRFLDANGNPIDGNVSSLGVWSTMILNNENRIKLQDGWQTMIDPVYGDTLIFNSFDYKEHALRPSPLTQDYTISMTGGNDKGKYYASFGSYDEEGFPINTFYNRITFLLNGEYKLKPWLTSTSGLNFARARWRDAVTNSEGNYLTRSLGAPPTMRGVNENGDLLVGRDVSDGNPAVNDHKFLRRNQSDKFTLSQAFKVDFLPNLYLRASGNWYYSEAINESFNKDYLQSPGSINTTRSSSASFSRSVSQTYNAILNYNETFANMHNLNLMAGTEFYDIYSNGLSASGSGAPTDDFEALGLTSSEQDRRSISSFHNRQRILSFFGRVNYDYDNRYLLTATFRRDGYSKLINNRWGDFPGVSVGWNISNEEFYIPLKNTINNLKLRGSYGINGNVDPNQIGPYNLQGSYGTNRYNSNVGYLLSGLPFPNLLWERSKTYEFGLEATILRKIDLSVSVYNRKTDNKISSFNLPLTAGYTSLTTNNGSMQNSGIEWDINYRILRSNDWTVDFSLNGAYNSNKVLKLPTNGLENNRQGGIQVYDQKSGRVIWVGGIQEGQDPNVAYAYAAEDLFRNQQQLESYGNRVDLNGARVLLGPGKYNSLSDAEKSKYYPIALGDVRWRDVDGNDTIDYRDRTYMGRTVPNLVGGFSAYAKWKNVYLSARFDFALGFVAYDGPRSWFQSMAQGSFNTTTDVFDTYTPDNTNAKYPTYYWADQLFKNNTFRETSMFYNKGDYLAFREVTIGYSLPISIASKIKSEGVDISFTGQNLGYWSKSTLYSPEASSVPVGGAGFGGYPLPRTFIIALKLTF